MIVTLLKVQCEANVRCIQCGLTEYISVACSPSTTEERMEATVGSHAHSLGWTDGSYCTGCTAENTFEEH